MALQDSAGFREYIRDALSGEIGKTLDEASDQALEDLYYSRRGESFRDEED